ncbi:uncharacterized protein LOC125861543 [Solanum stenotomum]|uniref:uncharacterized protein LOC125861543 n=1 Tax=Solanum stenotomum TaxID=172797 RepID=UPI0020D0C4C0|nr:uncharacterized protein LOC125861543 [Solanum stenotomum]
MKYILVADDYVSKWVEAVMLSNNEGKSVTAFLKKNIFSRFGTPRVIISDKGLRLFPGKLKSKWMGPFIRVHVFSQGMVELENENGTIFKVNGQRIKIYLAQLEKVKEAIEEWDLDEA